jgi:hypothetical protein
MRPAGNSPPWSSCAVTSRASSTTCQRFLGRRCGRRRRPRKRCHGGPDHRRCDGPGAAGRRLPRQSPAGWVVMRDPPAYPDKFTARLISGTTSPYVLVANTLESMRICGVIMLRRLDRWLTRCRLPIRGASARTLAGVCRPARAGLQEEVGAAPGPLHLLAFGEALADHGVHRGLRQGSQEWQRTDAPCPVRRPLP